jgi:hypothetical protein
LKHGILTALKCVPNGADLGYWCERKLLQSLDSSSCVQLVQALLELSKEGDFTDDPPDNYEDRIWVRGPLSMLYLLQFLMEAPACQRMTSHDIIRISKACLGPACCNICVNYLNDHENHISDLTELYKGCCCHPSAALTILPTVVALPAAADVGPCQLQELLYDACLDFLSIGVFKVLMRLPAAQQLTSAEVAAVLSKLLHSHCEHRLSGPYDKFGALVRETLKLPWVQQLCADDFAAVLGYLVQQPTVDGLVAVAGQLLRHPAGQQLSSDTLAHLMQATVWEK